ncbi:hypothetical protein ACWDBD_05045 [Streptomyces sp. NPDC001118]|uniref:hypothetical protein n=1 Tax=unclassified Streptomyces TaxID=2593676 RepID=UPI00331FACC1
MVGDMTWWQAAVWGVAGGFALDAVAIYRSVRTHRRWPWQERKPGDGEAGAVAYTIAGVAVWMVGGGLASAADLTGQISGPIGALTIGAAAPYIIERIARTVPLQLPESNLTPPETSTMQGASNLDPEA